MTLGAQRSLDFRYTLFGQLVRGFDVLTNINYTAVDTNNRPLADEIIQTASYVADTADTVLTLTATNLPGLVGTITVIADDGAGGRNKSVWGHARYRYQQQRPAVYLPQYRDQSGRAGKQDVDELYQCGQIGP